MNPFFTDYAEYMSRFFDGKIQKLSVNTTAGCPNRDGTVGTGGCIYCNNASFTPAYCFGVHGIREQLEAGKRFFGRKYKEMQYLAYFQSYTNTHRTETSKLEEDYNEALGVQGIEGIIVGTRPDCIGDEVIEILAGINRKHPVFVELGVETMHDTTLRVINRGHDSATAVDAIIRLADAGLHPGVHLIAGLPDEDEAMTLKSVEKICSLPIETIKMHHLQILRGTRMERMWREGKIKIKEYTPNSYLDLCVNIIERVPRRIAIERFLASAPPDMVISPKWGLKNYQFTNLLLNKLKTRQSK